MPSLHVPSPGFFDIARCFPARPPDSALAEMRCGVWRADPGYARISEESMPSLLGSLDLVPQAVVCGFEWGIAGQDVWDVARRLELVDQEQRGFAYAGAAMAFAIRDAVAGGGRR